MRIHHCWIGKALIALVALACTEGILYDPLCWSDSLDWAASHAIIKPLPSFRSFSGLKHKLSNQLTPQKTSSLTPPAETPQALAAVAAPVKTLAKATQQHNEPLAELRPLPKTYHAASVIEASKTPDSPKTVTAPSAPVAPAVAATPATPAIDPAMLQQMMLMNMLGNGGLNGNNGNNSNNTDPTTAMMNSMMGGDNSNSGNNNNGFNPMALMQLMQLQQASPSNGTPGAPAQNIDPEMIQTMLMGQLMNNMDFTGSNNKDNDR